MKTESGPAYKALRKEDYSLTTAFKFQPWWNKCIITETAAANQLLIALQASGNPLYLLLPFRKISLELYLRKLRLPKLRHYIPVNYLANICQLTDKNSSI